MAGNARAMRATQSPASLQTMYTCSTSHRQHAYKFSRRFDQKQGHGVLLKFTVVINAQKFTRALCAHLLRQLHKILYIYIPTNRQHVYKFSRQLDEKWSYSDTSKLVILAVFTDFCQFQCNFAEVAPARLLKFFNETKPNAQ